MTIAGISIILLLGILILALLAFQLLSGTRRIKVPFGLHRQVGFVIMALAMIHGFLAIMANL
ncbi:hypothetical protein LGV61_03520 [Desulfurispirillum indicum]|uniref:O-antigen polymerase n=1 Tax=Desulfurispirillum indicum (strain ATCC BAA-1389 / DSM 22839 / S5) TaxID=653733 RepID=E6W1Q9_DESIS|nr:hypothetical protein [Desulfurispirillum indicum]ADU65441.1 O-antigen polymerase [Desulfurispirillum indicum S5]UCZ57359.1 hypothetical protein LGV61_03520 [Desulfurispirillum indicum]